MGNRFHILATTPYIKDAAMFGFIRNEKETAVISNRIFEAVLYNSFIAEKLAGNEMYTAGAKEPNQFIVGGHKSDRGTASSSS